MLNVKLKKDFLKENIISKRSYPVFFVEYKNISPSHYWYKGIINEDDTDTEDESIKILDKGEMIEFILPEATALFAEIAIKDMNGNLIWKTQTLNKNRVIWYKENITGKKINEGKYYLQIKQGEYFLKGVIII